ncbi:scavenger receptor cysteine-rich domain superfamily protein-like [Anneissia japonica]|uniref:scavenger receptor cysteine-rich domain superfamily protein-like n=1 Tax=Anneissia japonica TaxID=1529436 RepID=UPI0014255C37|nr:scavenger receptor cysteine-rich domain superfamily protein-like [Anneissia japonica]
MLAVAKASVFIGIVFNVCVVTATTEVTVRLAGSTTPEMGRLEVRINGTWGTVHSSGWGESEAHVICRQLGYSAPVTYPLIGYFGQGTSMQVHMTHLKCTGREITILDCQYSRPIDDNHDEDVGVICQPENTSDYHVRLTDGSENSGRVEIFLHGTWGSICDKNWILNDATVVCRNLGFAAAVATHPSVDFGESSEVHLNDVTCLGTESGLRYCRHEVFNATTAATCSGGRAVGVTCLPKKDLQVRLVGSNSPNEGRIEVLLHDKWSPIKNHNNTDWELKEADVVCRSLGFETAYDAVTDGRFGDGQSRSYSMIDVKCEGHETSLESCVYEIATSKYDSSQGKPAVGVVCGSKNGNDGDVRLVDGKSANEGRLEIYYYGKWGSLCMDGWKSNAVQVACKQMGYPSANATINPIPGSDGQPIHLDDVICSGDEEGLSECQHEDWGIHTCSHSQDVAIKCNRYKDYDVRLVGGQVATIGRVEVFINNVWGAIFDKNWSLNESSVVCRSLGYQSESVSLCGTGYITSPAPKRFHKMIVKCLGSEANIQNCSTKFPGQQHQYDTSICIQCATNYEDKQILLMGGNTANEGVPKVYNAVTRQWDFICNNNVTFENNNVICRSIGFAYAKSISGSLITHSTFSTNQYGCFVKGIACNGLEIDVRDCPTVSEIMLQTNYNATASIRCKEFEEHSIRLVGGASPRQGRLEIYHDGQWGTVCISSWTTKIDAGVACRSLGLGPPPLNSSVPQTNPGTGPIHLSDVSCNGSENSIADCNHGDWGINMCTHDYDVMLKCSDPIPSWCGNAFCKEDELCKLTASSGFYCQSTSKKEDSRGQYLAVVLPILVFFVILACYISARLCHTLPVQPHKDCLNLLRRCCGKKASNYRIVLTASDEIILVENAS